MDAVAALITRCVKRRLLWEGLPVRKGRIAMIRSLVPFVWLALGSSLPLPLTADDMLLAHHFNVGQGDMTLVQAGRLQRAHRCRTLGS